MVRKVIIKRRAPRKAPRVAHLRPATKRAITRLVKNTVETKRQYYNLADTDLGGSQIYAMDLTKYISQGTGEVQRVGDSISNVYCHVAANWSWVGYQLSAAKTRWSGGSVRLMLVRTVAPIVAANTINVLSNATSELAPLFLNSVQTISSPLNTLSSMKVLAQKYIHSTCATDTNQRLGSTNLGFMSKLLTPRQQYVDGTGNQPGRKYNYYLVATSSVPICIGADTMGTLQLTATVSYKDA
jgi:hypothetical protein